MRIPDVDNGVVADYLEGWSDVPRTLGPIKRRIIQKKVKTAFLDRQHEILVRRGAITPGTPAPSNYRAKMARSMARCVEKTRFGWRIAQWVVNGLEALSKWVDKVPYEFIPVVEKTPVIVYNVVPAFDKTMLEVMDAPERAEHIRISKLRRKIQPSCEYDVLYYTEVPSWLQPHQYGKLAHLTPPLSLLTKLGYSGCLISLTRARLIAKEIAQQGCFGVIVGMSPKGFHYEMFGGHDAFVQEVVKPAVYEKSYRMTRDFEFREVEATVGDTITYELVDGRHEEETPTLRRVEPTIAMQNVAEVLVAARDAAHVADRFANRD